MADPFHEMQKKSLDELIQIYDQTARTTGIGLNFIREEIARRETAAQNERMIAFTRQMRNMTIAITGLTVLVAALTIINLILVLPL